jgi:epoxyqueuosine reductase QueG
LKLLDMDERQFVRTFGSFNWSIDFITFKRNVLIALGNSGDRSVLKEVKKFMNHGDKILSDVSLWAQKRINHTE